MRHWERAMDLAAHYDTGLCGIAPGADAIADDHVTHHMSEAHSVT
jgi:hypothetical protein